MQKNNLKKVISLTIAMSSIFVAFGTHANVQTDNTGIQQIIVEKEMTVYQLSTQYQLTTDEFLKLNGGLKVTDKVVKGTIIKVPNAAIKPVSNNIVSKEPEVLLPALSNGSSANPSAPSLLSEGITYVPGQQFVTGTTEQNTANLAVATAEQDWDNISAKAVLDNIEQQSINKVTGAVNSAVNSEVNQFLGKFGKAQANITIDEKGEVQNADVKVLTPLFDDKESLIFSQIGVHNQDAGDDSRTVGNFGIGYRYETKDWLVGANTFIDHDFTGNNTRLGLGSEFWIDNLKFAANGYAPLSNWKESKVMKNHEALIFDEKPASGFDLRANAFLPSYPQLGGSVTYEQYFGDEVALFGVQERQKDPYSLGIGIDYMPIPLVKTQISHKMGKSGADETQFDINLNLQLGTPIEEQLDPNNVATARSLKGSRYDMVDRNYDIVFEYKKESFELSLTGDAVATFGQQVSIKANVESRSPIKKYEWTVTDILGNPLQFIESNTPNITFTVNNAVDHYVRVKVTTERGYEATSKAHLISYKTGQSESVLEGENKIAEVIKFANYPMLDQFPIIELDKIDNQHKATLTFTAKTLEGQDFDLTNSPDLELLWKFPNETEYKVVSQNELIRLFAFPIDGQLNQRKVVAIADEAFIPVAGNRVIDIALISKINPTINAQSRVTFTRTDPVLNENGIDAQNLIMEIWEVSSSPSAVRSVADASDNKLVSRSGFINGTPISVTSNDIKPDTTYQVKIFTLLEPFKDLDQMVDVTDRYVKNIVWLYWDPLAQKEITADGNNGFRSPTDPNKVFNALEGCRGSNTFVTQVNNYDFNELAWGTILAEDQALPRQQQTTTEQGLRLAVQFDFRELNEANPIIEECKPTIAANTSYVGYVAATGTKKIGLWSDAK